MSARFGAERPYVMVPRRVYYLVGAFSTMAVGIAGALIALFSNDLTFFRPGASGPVIAEATQLPPPIAETVEVLYTKQRIVPGSRLSSLVLGYKSIPKELLPEGALLAEHKNQVISMYARVGIPANSYLVDEHLSEERPIGLLDIPAGYRAVTIEVDRRSGVEGFARPDTRVDVHWFHKDRRGEQRLSTIVTMARVLSVAGKTDVEGQATVPSKSTTVSLLVSADDARRIELARSTGELSLSLVGENEPAQDGAGEALVTYSDLLSSTEDASERFGMKDVNGLCSVADPYTGQRIQFMLSKNRWERQDERTETEEQLRKQSWLEETVPGFTAHKLR